VASLFCPLGQLPDGFVFGCPLLPLWLIAADAAPLAANVMAAANKAMRFFKTHPFLVRVPMHP
jgi:hypothetical protein